MINKMITSITPSNALKTAGLLTAWLALCATVLYAVLVPQQAVLFQSPVTVVGLGLVGLGLCMRSRRQLQTAAAASV